MPATQPTTEEKLVLAKYAINHVLDQIARSPMLRDKMGAATESFARLTCAFAAITGEELDEVMEGVFPGSSSIPHWSIQEMIESID